MTWWTRVLTERPDEVNESPRAVQGVLTERVRVKGFAGSWGPVRRAARTSSAKPATTRPASCSKFAFVDKPLVPPFSRSGALPPCSRCDARSAIGCPNEGYGGDLDMALRKRLLLLQDVPAIVW
jgi:hypothetical protein